jgi:DNA-binding NarL/FixJ family response regulator
MNGLDLIDRAREQQIPGKFILLTSIVDIHVVKKALAKGIGGYITKDVSKDELVEAIQHVFADGHYINNSLKDKIIEQQFTPGYTSFNLSKREHQVLQKICEGNTHKEIANELGLSLNTIHHYIKNMMGKLKINRPQNWCCSPLKMGFTYPKKTCRLVQKTNITFY